MARDEAQVAQRTAEQVRRLLGRVAVARAVSAVAADTIIVVVASRQRVHVGLRGHGGVKGRVKDGDLGRAWHERGHHIDAGVSRRVVQRRQLLTQLKFLAGRPVDDDGLGEVLAAGHDAVADGVNLRKVADGTLRIVHQRFQKFLQALGYRHIRHMIGDLLEIGRKGHVHVSVGGSHLLGQALHERNLAVSLDKLALQRRRTRIHDQYAHEHFPSIQEEPARGRLLNSMVGLTGFEPAASASRTQRSTKLSHNPKVRPCGQRTL